MRSKKHILLDPVEVFQKARLAGDFMVWWDRYSGMFSNIVLELSVAEKL